MTERRYSETEVAEIFERATSPAQSASHAAAPSGGMTLTQLQEIGAEVGIPADSIALAASTIEQTTLAEPKTFLGLKRSVSRTVQLERSLTESEWERLVVELRDTFNAQGHATSQGTLRQWTNGNLHVMLEPTATGQRIRFRTRKSDAGGMLGGGLILFGTAGIIVGFAAQLGNLGDKGLLAAAGVMGGVGAVMFASTVLRLPRWARTRQQQFDALAARVALLAKAPSPGSDK